jgi:hypothetical protein
MISSLAKALSQRPADELRKMLNDARVVAQRSQFEVEVIEEALSSAQDRPKVPVPVRSAPSQNRPSPQEARGKVLQIIREIGRVPPKAIKDRLDDDRINVYNTLGQLVKEGELTRDDGTYGFPTSSANGLPPGGLKAGTQLRSPDSQYGP